MLASMMSNKILFVLAPFPQEDLMEKTIADMHSRMRFIESLYRARQEDIIALQVRFEKLLFES